MVYARNLHNGPPRRWSDELDGTRWLPRLIDKARAAQAGSLGTYLYGQSPVDADCLSALGMGHSRFAAIVAAAPDDQGVIAALRERDASAFERAQAWSRTDLTRKWGWLMHVLDIDDGYVTPWYRQVVQACADAVARSAKTLWPAKPRA